MRVRTSRLERVSETLTAKQRALLVLKAWRDGQEEDPLWRRMMPAEQLKEFRRYLDLVQAVNVDLARYVALLEQQAESSALRLGWVATLWLWGLHASRMATFVEEFVETSPEARRDALKALSSGPTSALSRPAGDDEDEASLPMDGVMEDLRGVLLVGIPELWRQVRAVDAVIEEVARELGGEDPVLQEFMILLERTREATEKLSADARRFLGEVPLAGPSEEEVEQVRGLVGLRAVGLGAPELA